MEQARTLGSTAFPIGVSTWLWTSPLSDADIERLAPIVRGWGFDIIELPIEQPGDWDPVLAAELVAEAGLGTTTCAVMTPDRDLTTTDPEVTASTQAYLHQCIDIAAAVGSPVVAGPIYAPVARLWPMDPDERRRTVARLVEALRPVAAHAGRQGVRLALEPLNRYETSLVNTVEQAMEVVAGVDSPSLGVLLDTFHLNIEEKDPAAASGGRRAHRARAGLRDGPRDAGRRRVRVASVRRRARGGGLRRPRVHRVLHGPQRVDRPCGVDLASPCRHAGCPRGRRSGLPASAVPG